MTKKPLGIALIGAGRIGSSHAEIVARRLVDADLVGIADPAPEAAKRLGDRLGVFNTTTNVAAILADKSVEAVIIATPPAHHTNLVEQAAAAGKAVFVEKPMALTIQEADRAIAAAKAADVHLQVGFNRRWDQAFAEGFDAIKAGKVGTPQLLRSVTRDPGPWKGDPARVPLWTIFYETLIHDFDTLNWLNAGAKPYEVYAIADALVRPDARAAGHLDTAVVTIRYENGAIAVAEANFSALYGYDIRGEVFGSAGKIEMGNVRRSSMTLYDAAGVSNDTWRLDTDHFIGAYTAQLQGFVTAVRGGSKSVPNGSDARTALAIALAAIESVKRSAPVSISDIAAL